MIKWVWNSFRFGRKTCQMKYTYIENHQCQHVRQWIPWLFRTTFSREFRFDFLPWKIQHWNENQKLQIQMKLVYGDLNWIVLKLLAVDTEIIDVIQFAGDFCPSISNSIRCITKITLMWAYIINTYWHTSNIVDVASKWNRLEIKWWCDEETYIRTRTNTTMMDEKKRERERIIDKIQWACVVRTCHRIGKHIIALSFHTWTWKWSICNNIERWMLRAYCCDMNVHHQDFIYAIVHSSIKPYEIYCETYAF